VKSLEIQGEKKEAKIFTKAQSGTLSLQTLQSDWLTGMLFQEKQG